MNVTRRRLLAAGAMIGTVTLPGCSNECGLPFFGTSASHEGVIAVELTDSIPAEATVVEFSEVSSSEQSLLRTAISDGAVKVCTKNEGERTDALYSFADRLDIHTSYLSYEDEYYALLVGIEDVGYAATAEDVDVPKGNPCC